MSPRIEGSEFKVKYDSVRHAYLEKVGEFGGINIQAFFDDALVWLSGRMVTIKIEDGKQIKITADKSEKVFGVYFTHNNTCEVPAGAEKTVCKIRQQDCCVFLISGGYGFQCGKFNPPLARVLLDQLAEGKMRAKRIGNCTVLGRKK